MYSTDLEYALRVAKVKRDCKELLIELSKKEAIQLIADILVGLDADEIHDEIINNVPVITNTEIRKKHILKLKEQPKRVRVARGVRIKAVMNTLQTHKSMQFNDLYKEVYGDSNVFPTVLYRLLVNLETRGKVIHVGRGVWALPGHAGLVKTKLYKHGTSVKVINLLRSKPGISITEISKAVYGDNGHIRNVSSLLTNLKNKGLVKHISCGKWAAVDVIIKSKKVNCNARSAMILDVMRTNPSISVKDLSMAVYGQRNPNLGSALDTLLIKGLVKHPSRGIWRLVDTSLDVKLPDNVK